ncbi:MAG: hypothetical protein ACRYHQ_16115, partial [Janthinobacterium lividum]
AAAIPRPLHDVTGHWKHSRKHGDPRCEHAYVRETPSRERCVTCRAARWWVRDFQRGDEAVGVVARQRVVTA